MDQNWLGYKPFLGQQRDRQCFHYKNRKNDPGIATR